VRARILLLVLAVSSLILLSFMLPLALLLRTFTAQNALNSATIRGQFMAPLVATLSTTQLQQATERVNEQNPAEPVTIFMPDGTIVGAPAPMTADVRRAAQGKSLTASAPGGVAIYVAVLGAKPQGTAVIRTFVPESQLHNGVREHWLVLGAVAAGLLAMAIAVALQLSRTLIRPLRDVAHVAERLADGDLQARTPTYGPPEIRQVSDGLNRLAARIGVLLAHERETLADLSHRLRTPLTALRIDAELLTGDQELMNRVIGDVDALTGTVNEIIDEARRPTGNGANAACDAAAVVRDRAAYWWPLAEDQERWMTIDMPPHRLPVRVSPQDLAACVDILLENVFSHTPEGTAFSVRVSERSGGGAWLAVSDGGPGFSLALTDPASRGNSGAGSTGLGLDIARRIAEGSGGTLTVGRSPSGGGAVTIGLGPAAPWTRQSRHRRTGRPARPTTSRRFLARRG
jgi:signal transduction histidine kinase